MERRSKRAGIAVAVVLAGCLLGMAHLDARAFATEDASVSASTEVIVRTAPETLTIFAVSDDVVGTVDEVRAVTLAVDAAGSGALSYRWVRTVDGRTDAAFFHDGSTCPLTDVEEGTGYVYTVTVQDETGASVSASVIVQVTATEGEYVNERITFPHLGVTIEANHHRNVDFVVSVQPLGTDAFSRLSSLAEGARMRPPAYSIRLVGQADSAPAYVGAVRISFPSPGASAAARAYAADEGEPVRVLFVDEAGAAVRVPGTEAAGWVTFETKDMGDFVVLADEDQASGSEDGVSDSSAGGSLSTTSGTAHRLSATKDSSSRSTAALVTLAVCGACTLAVCGGRTLRSRVWKR